MRAIQFSFIAVLLFAACGEPAAWREVGPPPSANTRAERPASIAPGFCESGALRLEANVGDATSKEDLLEVWRVIARYPAFRVRPVPSQAGRAAMAVSLPAGCHDRACALAQGWESLSADLGAIEGVELECDTSIDPHGNDSNQCPSPGKQEQSQDQKQSDEKGQQQRDESQDGGGVGVGS